MNKAVKGGANLTTLCFVGFCLVTLAGIISMIVWKVMDFPGFALNAVWVLAHIVAAAALFEPWRIFV